MPVYSEKAEERYGEVETIEQKQNLLKSIKEMLADLSEARITEMEDEEFEKHTEEVAQLQKLAGRIKAEIKFQKARSRGDEEKLAEAMRNAQQAFWDTLDGRVDEPLDFSVEITGYVKNYHEGETLEWSMNIPKGEDEVE